MLKTMLLLSLVLVTAHSHAADCKRAAEREAKAALGRNATATPSMSEGLGDDHFIIRYHAILDGRREGMISCESYRDVCDCRFL